MLELRDHRPRQRIDFAFVAGVILDGIGIGLEEVLTVGEPGNRRPLTALDQHFDGAVGQLEQLQHCSDRAHGIDIGGRGIVLGRVFLGHQENLLVVFHDVLEGAHGLLAADEERHDHVGKHHDVAER